MLLHRRYMCFHFRTATVALLAVMQIVLSFPLMFFFVDIVFRQGVDQLDL